VSEFPSSSKILSRKRGKQPAGVPIRRSSAHLNSRLRVGLRAQRENGGVDSRLGFRASLIASGLNNRRDIIQSETYNLGKRFSSNSCIYPLATDIRFISRRTCHVTVSFVLNGSRCRPRLEETMASSRTNLSCQTDALPTPSILSKPWPIQVRGVIRPHKDRSIAKSHSELPTRDCKVPGF
jgi:hypothetical protein